MTMRASAIRLLVSTGCALAALYWLDLGPNGPFLAIAGGFCAYAALTAAAALKVAEPGSAAYGTTTAGDRRRVSTFWRWSLDSTKSRRALAALDDDQLHNLSDCGRRIRREALREAGRGQQRR
jgi:hypothetical protein